MKDDDQLTDEALVDIITTWPCMCRGNFRCTQHLAMDEFLRRRNSPVTTDKRRNSQQ